MLVTSSQLFQQQAPSFNFELGEEELLAQALKVGFVTKVSEDQYEINEQYGE